MSNSLSETSSTYIIGPCCDFLLTLSNVNNKGADQPVHPRNLISTFVVHILKSMTAKLATCKISRFQIVSEAKQADLSLS